MNTKAVLLIMIVLLVFSACQKSETSNTKTTITVAAAASLKNCMENDLIPIFEEANPEIEIESTYDGSGKLQLQIEGGAAIDVFLSAAKDQMDALIEKQLIDEIDYVELLENKLVLIVPSQADDKSLTFDSLNSALHLAIGDPKSVPAGQYSRELLMNLNLWEDLSRKVSLGSNVTEVLNWVAAGSADAGIVYSTDAKFSDAVTLVEIAPEEMVSKITYPVGILNSTKEYEAAKIFLDFLKSDEASRVFKSYGFSTLF